MRFKETPEFQQRGSIGHAFGGQVDAGKPAQGLAIVKRVFNGFVGQAIPLLEEIDAQHPLQSNGRTAAFALGIMRLDDSQHLRPRNDFLHAGQKLLATGGLLFGGKLGLGKTRLVGHASQFRNSSSARLH
jgi:hypothetical protein